MASDSSKEGMSVWHDVGKGEHEVDEKQGWSTQEELEAEATQIENSNILAEQSTHIVQERPSPPQLLVEQGRDKGKTYVLNPGETSIGRGIDNEVILTDVTVSRKHLKILHVDGVLTLKDLGSGNGTLVNGRSQYEMVLGFNDKIRIGDTTLTVVAGSGSSRADAPTALVPHVSRARSDQGVPGIPPNHPSETARPVMYSESQGTDKSKGSVVVPKSWFLSITVVGGLLLLSLAVTVISLWFSQRDDMRTSSALEQGQTIELLDQGETALKAGRLDEAEKHISQVLLENPENARAVALMKQIQDIRHKTQ